MLTSYGKVYGLGHKATQELLLDPVVVEEKVDGSQISFGVSAEGKLYARSHHSELNLDEPDKMFKAGVEVIKSLHPSLRHGWTYRGEYLNKPKHNVLAYERTPKNNIVIFDIDKGDQDYLAPADKQVEAARLGLETVPLLFFGTLSDLESVQKLIDSMSMLGGQKVEGVVIKNYFRFGIDKKILLGKLVREDFKEQHKREWNSGDGDSILVRIIKKHKTDARWNKAVQHLKEKGLLEESPKDIGQLMREVPSDLFAEEKQDILDMLWAWAEPSVRRGVVAGLPEWYKAKLLDKQFEKKDEAVSL